MNTNLIGGLALIGYAVYTYVSAKSGGLDLNSALYAKVGVASLGGISGIVYNYKDAILGVLKGVKKTQVVGTPEVTELDITSLEQEDTYCINFLMKRVKRANHEDGVATVKKLNDIMYDIHLKETKDV